MVSKSDIKTLNRIKLSRDERIVVENYWDKVPPAKSGAVSILARLIMPAIVAALIAAHFGAVPRALNLVRFTLWIICGLSSLVHIVITGVASGYKNARDEKILDRLWIKMLPGGSSRFNTYWHRSLWLASIALCASLGFFITAGACVGTLIFELFLNSIASSTVREALPLVVQKEKIQHGSIEKIITIE